MASRRNLKGFAKLMRLSNLPTCLANVLTGAAIGMRFGDISLVKIAAVAFAVCCYYCGGMILNDLCDIGYDRKHRSDRPLAAGTVSFQAALILTLLMFAAATGIIIFTASHAISPAVALLGCIVLYDVIHKKNSFSVILMGLCRSLVYVTAAVAVAAGQNSFAAVKFSLPFAILLGFYTLSITIIARCEDNGKLDFRKWLSIMMPLAMFIIIFVVRPRQILYAVIVAAIFAGWMLRGCGYVFSKPPKIKHAVLTWLSGMCLVDMWFLTVLDRPLFAIVAFACFLITFDGHKRISGT